MVIMSSRFKSSSRIFISLGFFLLISAGVVAGVILSTQSQDNRQQASFNEQTVSITVSSDAPLVPNTTATLHLKAQNLDQSALNGLQVVLDLNFSAAVPSDVQFSQTTITGMQAAGTNISAAIGGKHLTVGFLTSNPSLPISLSGDQALGTITFTVPASGELNVSFDDVLTRVIQNSSGTDIAKTSQNQTLIFTKTENPIPAKTDPPIQNPNIGGENLDILDRSLQGDKNSAPRDEAAQPQTVTPPQTPKTTGVNSSVASHSSTILAQTKTKPQAKLKPSAQPQLPDKLPETGSNSALLLGIGGVILIACGLGLYLDRMHHDKK